MNPLSISIINIEDLNLAHRIDAEHYQPHYLEIVYTVQKRQHKKLSEVVSKTITTGHTPSMKEDRFYGGSIKFVKTDNLRDNHITDDFSHYLSDEGSQKLKNSALKPDDILITIIGATYEIVGRVARVFDDLGPAHINQNIALVRSILPAGYLTCFLLGKYGKQQLYYLSRQTEQVNLNNAEVGDVLVPIPSDAFAQSIHKLHDQTHTLQIEAKGLYKEAEQLLLSKLGLNEVLSDTSSISVKNLSDCVDTSRLDAEYWQPDFDTVEAKIRANKTGYDTLDNLFEVSDTKARIEADKQYQYIELADVNTALGTVDGSNKLEGKELPSRARMVLKQEDLILSSVEGSIDKVALISTDDKNLLGSTGFFVLRKKGYEPEVGLLLLKSAPVQALIKRQAQGTILSAVPKTSLHRVLLPEVDADTQKTIRALIQKTHQKTKEAKSLVEKAVRAVEVSVENSEEAALEYLKKNV